MLVLGRDLSDEVVVTHGGERLIVSIARIHGQHIWLGFEGPQSFVIHRAEVQNAIDEQGPHHIGTDEVI